MNRTWLCTIVFFLFQGAVHGAAPSSVVVGGRTIELAAIWKSGDRAGACLTISREHNSRSVTLTTNEIRDGIELMSASSAPPEVKLRIGKEEVTLGMDEKEGDSGRNETAGDEISCRAAAMGLDQFIDFYSMVTGRSVIRDFSIGEVIFNFHVEGTRRSVVQALGKVLAEKQLVITEYPDKFAILIPAKSFPPKVPKEKTVLIGVDENDVVSDFWVHKMPFHQFRQIYEAYSGKKVSLAPEFRAEEVTFKAASLLTRKELVQALETILTVNGYELEHGPDATVTITKPKGD